MMRLKTVVKFVSAIVLILVLLWGGKYRDISKYEQVAGVSVDPAGAGKYRFGLEIAELGKGSDFTVTSKTVSVQARNLSEALRQAGLQREYPLRIDGAGLIVVHSALIGGHMSKISEMVLSEWTGDAAAYIAVADGVSALEILKNGEQTDLRSGQLSGQIRRAQQQGMRLLNARRSASRYLSGETLILPLVRVGEEDYRIVGSITVSR